MTDLEDCGDCGDNSVPRIGGKAFTPPYIAGAGAGSNLSDGQSGFYVDGSGDPVFVKSIYDEETKSFSYFDYSDNPLVPGVDFFPSSSGAAEVTATGGNLDIPDNSVDWALPVITVRTVTVIREGTDPVTIDYNGIMTMQETGSRTYGSGDGATLLDITNLKITTGANSNASVIWEV